MVRNALIAILLTGAAPLAAQEADLRDSDFRVSNIEARLLYEQTGRLSADITDNPDFHLWNTSIGAGSAEENANDLLVTAVIVGPGQHNIRTPLTITVRDARGRLLGTRRIADMLAEGRTYRSLLLHDVACAGAINLTAEFGTSRRTEEIDLACGE